MYVYMCILFIYLLTNEKKSFSVIRGSYKRSVTTLTLIVGPDFEFKKVFTKRVNLLKTNILKIFGAMWPKLDKSVALIG